MRHCNITQRSKGKGGCMVTFALFSLLATLVLTLAFTFDR